MPLVPNSSSAEMVEVVDEENHTVEVVPRNVIRANNLLHRTVAILCRNRTGEIYVHRRTGIRGQAPGQRTQRGANLIAGSLAKE